MVATKLCEDKFNFVAECFTQSKPSEAKRIVNRIEYPKIYMLLVS